MVCFDKSFVKGSDLMENDKQKQSRALSVLLEAIEETNSNDILIGERKREIERLENKKEKEIRRTRIAAANYFTRERIIELHERSVNLLRCNDFDENEYIQIFSDISTIEIAHIDFLVQRQGEIEAFEASLNKDLDKPVQIKKTLMTTLADIFMKGGANDD